MTQFILHYLLILFTFICIGTIFATSDRFVDSQIMPKWLAMSLGIILLANYLIIRFLFFSHLKGTYKNKKAIYIIGTIVIVTFAQALYGIFQFFNLLPPTTAFRVTGSFDNPAGFAASLRCSSFLYMGDYKIAKYFALDANRYHILNNTSNYIFRITFRNPKCISNSFLLEHSKN